VKSLNAGEKSIYLVIPAYGSEPLLMNVVQNIPTYVKKTLLIWDNPVENSLKRIQSLKKNDVEIIIRNERGGIGLALQHGVKRSLECLDKSNGFILFMAGNGKDNPKEIINFLHPLYLGYHYIQGSRYLKDGNSKNLPFIRKITNKILPIIWSIIVRKKLSEVTNGFRAYNSIVFKESIIPWYRPDLNGYEWEYYLNYKLLRSSYRCTEVAVSKIYYKGVNHSKIKLRDGYQILRPIFLCPVNRV